MAWPNCTSSRSGRACAGGDRPAGTERPAGGVLHRSGIAEAAHANVVEFHDDPELRVLFASDAGGVGLNLQRAASCCINLEIPWNPAVLEQRIARIHRLGQSEPVDVYTLVSVASIEARIAASVANKQALFSGLFDGTSDEVAFDGTTGFLSTLEKLVPAVSTDAPDDDHELDEEPGVADDGVDRLLTAADDSAPVERPAPPAPADEVAE